MSAAVWTDERIREAFIYDGGEAEYHDPISGAQTQRHVAGSIFDAWLAAHDAALLATVSTPPAEDVREALAEKARDSVDRIGGWKHLRKFSGMNAEWMDVLRDAIICRVADALGEVRPRGTVTDAEAEHQGTEYALEVGYDAETDGIIFEISPEDAATPTELQQWIPGARLVRREWSATRWSPVDVASEARS